MNEIKNEKFSIKTRKLPGYRKVLKLRLEITPPIAIVIGNNEKNTELFSWSSEIVNAFQFTEIGTLKLEW